MGIRTLYRNRPTIIEVYRGYASPHRTYLRGRVRKQYSVHVDANESMLNTLWDNIRRFASLEVPNVPLEVLFAEQEFNIKTDREGFLTVDLPSGPMLADEASWRDVHIAAPQHPNIQGGKGEIYLPSSEATFGVITDVDDTILLSETYDWFKVIRHSLFRNPLGRRPLLGMSEWIRAFHKKNETHENPIFYLSKSPRNYFSYLKQFLQLQQFPQGPLLLRDFGRKGDDDEIGGYKEGEIRRILNAYPNLPFVLIGDIAGKDVSIYHTIEMEFPGRILAIYIRDVAAQRKRKRYQDWLANNPTKHVFITSTSEGARHALELGIIREEAYHKINEQVNGD